MFSTAIASPPSRHRPVRKVKLADVGLMEGMLERVDYLDAYQRRFPSLAGIDLEQVAAAIFSGPEWTNRLMAARDRICGRFGLKTVPKGSALPFELIAKTDEELLLGEDDKHLDFRVLIRVEPAEEESLLTLATAVHLRNLGGRAYFFMVKPFHRVIVRSSLRKAMI